MIPRASPFPVCRAPVSATARPQSNSNGISELAISADGTHILLGQKVSEDADRNVYYRLYMDINDSSETVELTPGATDGVLFNGMTSDGSEVFFTTKDKLPPPQTRTPTKAPISTQAEVSESGATLNRISTGTEGTGNTDACEPVSNKDGAHWNSLEATANCGVSRSAAVGGWPPKAAPSTSSPQSSSTAPQTASKTSPTSTLPPLGSLPASSPPSAPKTPS